MNLPLGGLFLKSHFWNVHISSNAVDVVVCTFTVSEFDKMKNADVQYANTCYKNVTFSDFSCLLRLVLCNQWCIKQMEIYGESLEK